MNRDLLIHLKAVLLREIGKYKKALPATRASGLKFQEDAFKIRFELKSFNGLKVGDIVKVNRDFYKKITNGEIAWNVAITENDRAQLEKNSDHKVLGGDYILVCFVEMPGKNFTELFCVLAETNPFKILEGEKESLLLFWRESLEKIKMQ